MRGDLVFAWIHRSTFESSLDTPLYLRSPGYAALPSGAPWVRRATFGGALDTPRYLREPLDTRLYLRGYTRTS